MRRSAWILVVISWCASHSVVAHAQQTEAPERAPAPPPPPAAQRWYGAPILIGGEIGAVGIATEGLVAMHGTHVPTALWLPTLGVYLLTGPIVHIAHDEPLNALASLGLNVAMPLAGIFVGFDTLLFATDCDNGFPHASGPPCSRVPFKTFFTLGFIAAPLLDGLLLAHQSPAPPPRDENWKPTFTPFASPNGKDGFILGLAGLY